MNSDAAKRVGTVKLSAVTLLVFLLVGCATFEQTPQDVLDKLSDPTKGRLYETDPTLKP